MFDPPIFINCRDRVEQLRELVTWLEHAGHQRIVLLDNASTYPPLLEYLAASPHEVRRLDRNEGARSLWNIGVPNEWFVYTDPDLVPIADCPTDAVTHLREILDRHPEHDKAALGLHLDDVPPSMPSLEWEHRLLEPWDGDPWLGEIEPGVFDSLNDTTFALYRPGAPFELKAIRTGFPYQVRHVPWYRLDAPTAEEAYYLDHIPDEKRGPQGSSWAESWGRSREAAA